MRAGHVPEFGAAALGQGLEHCPVVFGDHELDVRVQVAVLEETFDGVEGVGAKVER